MNTPQRNTFATKFDQSSAGSQSPWSLRPFRTLNMANMAILILWSVDIKSCGQRSSSKHSCTEERLSRPALLLRDSHAWAQTKCLVVGIAVFRKCQLSKYDSLICRASVTCQTYSALASNASSVVISTKPCSWHIIFSQEKSVDCTLSGRCRSTTFCQCVGLEDRWSGMSFTFDRWPVTLLHIKAYCNLCPWYTSVSHGWMSQRKLVCFLCTARFAPWGPGQKRFATPTLHEPAQSKCTGASQNGNFCAVRVIKCAAHTGDHVDQPRKKQISKVQLSCREQQNCRARCYKSCWPWLDEQKHWTLQGVLDRKGGASVKRNNVHSHRFSKFITNKRNPSRFKR